MIHKTSAVDTLFTSVFPLHQRIREIEVRYFCSLGDVLRNFGRNYPQRQLILQAYIPKKLQAKCIESLGPLAQHLAAYNLEDFTVTRLRKISAQGKSRFYLQLKTKKRKRVERMEVSLELTSSRFANLLKFATGGVLLKTRLVDEGSLTFQGGASHKLEAHIDLIHYAGSWLGFKQNAGSRKIQKFALIDIEFPRTLGHEKLDEAARRSFDFLKNAICLLEVRRKVRKSLSARSLASLGLEGHSVQASLRKLDSMLARRS